MKVSNLAGPMGAQVQSTTNSAAQARAVAALMGTPPIDQNNISPENSSLSRQSDTGEGSEEPRSLEAAVADRDGVPEEVAQEGEEQVVDEKPKEDLSEQHQKLLRREKALLAQKRQQEQSFKQREEALKAREAALDSNKPDMSRYVDKDDLTADPLGTLTALGYSADQIANMLIQQQQPQDPRMVAEMKAMRAELKRLQAAGEEQKKASEEQQTQAYQQAVKQIESDVKKMVFTDPAYEMVKATNSISDVIELIERTWKEEGVLMDNHEALQQVEDYLVDEALKLANSNKIKSRLAPKVAQPSAKVAQEQKPASPKQQQPMKTLTNASASSRQLSAKERAILAFKGELK